ncbi:hypothetical protein OG21DRAFT_1515395 [Imleria badia]|nr:hypothetical protein OG21DRAFT_1515395 [Imleria badia]
MKFTIPTYLVLLACLATTLASIKEEGIRKHAQNDRTTSDSFSGAYAKLTEPGINTLEPDTDMRILL